MSGVDPIYSELRTPERSDLAVCGNCGNALHFWTDGMGNVDEHCPRCAELARLRASVRHVSAVTTEKPLPLAPPLQMMATTTPQTRIEAKTTPNATSTHKRKHSPKSCPCGVTYTPTGPRQQYHAVDCPARGMPAPAAAPPPLDPPSEPNEPGALVVPTTAEIVIETASAIVVETVTPPVGQGPGMPAALYLDDFGAVVHDAFGEHPYHVGSSLKGKQWRDVDVRLILADDEYEAMGFGNPDRAHSNPKWVALVKAFSALGQQMTGLPIDFQIQQQTRANDRYGRPEPRSALGLHAYFRARPDRQ